MCKRPQRRTPTLVNYKYKANFKVSSPVVPLVKVSCDPPELDELVFF